MARYVKGQILKGKDGKEYRFLGGDDTDKSSFEELPPVTPVTLPTMQQSMQEELADRNFLGKAAAGLGVSANKLYLGSKGLVTDLSKQEQERLALDKQIGRTAGGMTGAIAGDVGMTMLPFGAVSKVASKIPGFLTRTAAGIGGAGALGAGYGALTSPDDRKTGALLGGAGAAAGAGLGQLLGGFFKPAKGTAAAGLQEEGVPLTVGQATGGVTRRMEDAARAMSSNVAKLQGEAVEKWGQNLVNKTLPAGKKVAEQGREAIAAGAKVFDEAYDDAFSQMPRLVGDVPLRDRLVTIVRTYAPKLTKSDADTMIEQLKRIGGEFSGGLEGRALKDLRRSYESLATKAFNDGNARLAQAYREAASALDDVAARQAPSAAAAVRAVDEKYGQFIPVQRAAGKIGAEEGVFSPKHLIAAVRELDKSADKRAFARGTARPALLQEAEKAAQVLGPTIPTVGPGTAEKLAPMLFMSNPLTTVPSLAGQLAYTPWMQSFLTGGNRLQQAIGPEWQAALAASGRSLANR